MTEITIDVLVREISDIRRERRAAGKRTTEPTEAIFKIPAYNWTTDPNGYKDEDGSFGGRCGHCGSRFIHLKPWDAFCGPCHLAMLIGGEEMLFGFPGKKKIRTKIRIPDGVDESVYIKQLQDGSKVEFNTGMQEASKSV